MSSASPPKEPEVEPEAQSGDDQEHMERDNQDTQGQGQGEFEVKEQDRWLPIANGKFTCPCMSSVLLICAYLASAACRRPFAFAIPCRVSKPRGVPTGRVGF